MNDVPVTGADRTVVYPGNSAPTYPTQGHHCIALSALVENANSQGSRKDRRLRLNHYLKEVKWFPNRSSNCIQLPARKSRGDFDAFWKALDAKKPLQLHGPGHDESYFLQCDALLVEVVECIKSVCEDGDESQVLDELRKLVGWAENYAFTKLAGCDGAWDLHPQERRDAEKIYFLKPSQSVEVTKAYGVQERVHGLGNTPWPIRYPRLSLDCGPYA